MIQLEEIKKMLASHCLVRGVDQVPRGHVRIETKLLYPDSSSIDVFLAEYQPLLRSYRLTDFGQTLAMLLNVQVKPYQSKKRKGMLEDAIAIFDVIQEGGALQYDLPSFDELSLSEGIIRLGQACFRVSDLSFTRQSNKPGFFAEEVEDIIIESGVRYEPSYEVLGIYGSPVRLDFRVWGQRTVSSILTMSTAYPSVAHNQANEIFTRWHDLGILGPSEQKVTIFDDGRVDYRDQDLKRLETVSIVLPISDRRTIREVVVA